MGAVGKVRGRQGAVRTTSVPKALAGRGSVAHSNSAVEVSGDHQMAQPTLRSSAGGGRH